MADFWFVEATYIGFDKAYDDKLKMWVGKSSTSSGFNLMTSVRDIEWKFTHKDKAEAALQVLLDHGVNASMEAYSTPEEDDATKT